MRRRTRRSKTTRKGGFCPGHRPHQRRQKHQGPCAFSDERCRPLAFYLTPGQTADIKGAGMLGSHLPRACYLLADKAFSISSAITLRSRV